MNYARDLAQQLGFNVVNPATVGQPVAPKVAAAVEAPASPPYVPDTLTGSGTGAMDEFDFLNYAGANKAPATPTKEMIDNYINARNASNVANADPRFLTMNLNTDVQQVPNQMVFGRTPDQIYNRNTINTNVREPDMGMLGQRQWTPTNVWENFYDQMAF